MVLSRLTVWNIATSRSIKPSETSRACAAGCDDKLYMHARRYGTAGWRPPDAGGAPPSPPCWAHNARTTASTPRAASTATLSCEQLKLCRARAVATSTVASRSSATCKNSIIR